MRVARQASASMRLAKIPSLRVFLAFQPSRVRDSNVSLTVKTVRTFYSIPCRIEFWRGTRGSAPKPTWFHRHWPRHSAIPQGTAGEGTFFVTTIAYKLSNMHGVHTKKKNKQHRHPHPPQHTHLTIYS